MLILSFIQIVLLQEIPDTETHVHRKCQRLMLDTERSAELEGNSPGIHSIYFLEHFAQNWLGHAQLILQFIGLDAGSFHTKAAIKPKPSNLISRNDAMDSNPWKSFISI